MCRLPTSFLLKLSCGQICLCPQYSKSRQTGSGHAADSKMRYMIQFSILMLCAKYQEAGLSGSREKCDRNYLLNKFAYVHNIQSHVKQEVDMTQIQNCMTRYSSQYWCSVPNIRKLACVVREKNVTEFFCDADADDDDDDARRQKWSLYVASAKAGRRHNNNWFFPIRQFVLSDWNSFFFFKGYFFVVEVLKQEQT